MRRRRDLGLPFGIQRTASLALCKRDKTESCPILTMMLPIDVRRVTGLAIVIILTSTLQIAREAHYSLSFLGTIGDKDWFQRVQVDEHPKIADHDDYGREKNVQGVGGWNDTLLSHRPNATHDFVVSEELTINRKNRQYDPSICQLFQFSVAGFAKCGTTSLGQWLKGHPETVTPPGESFPMAIDPLRIASQIQRLIQQHGPGVTGYRNPHDLQYDTMLDFFRNTCPMTKQLVTVRHPLLWFESFYNYRKLRNEAWSIKSEPNNLIGKICNEDPANVCADTGAFHRYLSKLGKTPLAGREELELLNVVENHRPTPPRLSNPIFLLEISQLNDSNETRLAQLGKDIRVYLGLKAPMPPIPHANSASQLIDGKQKPKRLNETIDICDSQYQPIHSHMMQIARNASSWIREYFLNSTDVVVSSRDHMTSLLESWMTDPCLQRRSGDN
jgi:hypothetical protein